MDRLVYTSLSAMRGSMARQAANANNIANINTVGFRGEYSAASAMYVRGETQPARAHASEEVVGADMRSGTVNVTAAISMSP
jgi:flagellar basal-body rod protein FlgF